MQGPIEYVSEIVWGQATSSLIHEVCGAETGTTICSSFIQNAERETAKTIPKRYIFHVGATK